MKIISSSSLGLMETFDLEVGDEHHSFVHHSGVVVHNSAFLITNRPVDEFIPLQLVSGVPVTQYTAEDCEKVGAIKMDFLGLNSLHDVAACINLIQERSGLTLPDEYMKDGIAVPKAQLVPFKGELLDIYQLPDDQAVYRDICEGRTETVFQFDTPSVQRLLHTFNAWKNQAEGRKVLDSIEALAAFTALDRPGPLDYLVKDESGKEHHNMLIEYAHRAKGKLAIGRVPILDELLPETFGVIVFQEQLTKVFREVGGTTGIEAENFRVHISKKKMEEVQRDKAIFMPGAVAKLGTKVAEELWASMETFGQYGFNKSHAVSYVMLSYACAFLKHHFPLEWWCAVLRNATRNDVNTKFWRHCGHLILLPDILKSTEQFEIEGNRIRAPIGLINGIGPKAEEQLKEMRADTVDEEGKTEIQKFMGRIERWRVAKATTNADGKTRKATSALNEGSLTSMVVSGTMDSLWPPNTSLWDKLADFNVAYAAMRGTKPQPVDEIWSQLSPLQLYLVRKEILSAYSEDLRSHTTRLSRVEQTDEGLNFKLDKESVPIVDVKEFEQLEGMTYIVDPIKCAVVAYIISDTAQKFHNTKTMRKLLVDIEGEHHELIKWPDRKSGKMEPSFPSDMTGTAAIVVCTRYRADRPFVVETAMPIAFPIKKKKDE